MGDTNVLMEFLLASLGATLDEIYQRLIDCDLTREDPGLAMFVAEEKGPDTTWLVSGDWASKGITGSVRCP